MNPSVIYETSCVFVINITLSLANPKHIKLNVASKLNTNMTFMFIIQENIPSYTNIQWLKLLTETELQLGQFPNGVLREPLMLEYKGMIKILQKAAI